MSDMLATDQVADKDSGAEQQGGHASDRCGALKLSLRGTAENRLAMGEKATHGDGCSHEPRDGVRVVKDNPGDWQKHSAILPCSGSHVVRTVQKVCIGSCTES
jgi:hypothetical protein